MSLLIFVAVLFFSMLGSARAESQINGVPSQASQDTLAPMRPVIQPRPVLPTSRPDKALAYSNKPVSITLPVPNPLLEDVFPRSTATVGEMINDPEVEAQLRLIMEEVTAVGRALGAEPSETSGYRIMNSRQNAMPHKSSMLQDLERGRMMEVNQIIGAVRELGQLVGVPTPTIDTVFALIRLRARIGGMLPD